MFKKITSNRNPRDTLASEIKKEFGPFFNSLRVKLQKITQNYPRFLFAMMVINITLSLFLVFKVLRHPIPPKKVVIATPTGFDQILQAGEKLKKTINLKRTIDSLTEKKSLSGKDSVLLDSALDQFRKTQTMTIDFKQPKYILPLIAFPFLCLFFYVYHSSAKSTKVIKHEAGINNEVGDVAPAIKKKGLSDKLDAFRNKYKETDGKTAVSIIPSEEVPAPKVNPQQTLDSINRVMQKRFNNPPVRSQEQVMKAALKHFQQPEPAQSKGRDPMELFRQQMAVMDSVRKSTDPAAIAERQKQEAKAKLQQDNQKNLDVKPISNFENGFNSITPQKDENFITATIDENVAGYAGSRIALKLENPITVGQQILPKGTELYALINGFSGQRVTMSIRSILFEGKLLPVKLDVYDQDGLAGLYVPNSQFREFTRDLGGSSIQGVSLDNGSASGVLMSTAGKLFESASSAVASAIRKNKAKIKYNTYIYLISTQ